MKVFSLGWWWWGEEWWYKGGILSAGMVGTSMETNQLGLFSWWWWEKSGYCINISVPWQQNGEKGINLVGVEGVLSCTEWCVKILVLWLWIEHRTFRSSVWRSPNWAIKACIAIVAHSWHIAIHRWCTLEYKMFILFSQRDVVCCVTFLVYDAFWMNNMIFF